jgi:hypothetical protein
MIDVLSLGMQQCQLTETRKSGGRTGLGGGSNEFHFGCAAMEGKQGTQGEMSSKQVKLKSQSRVVYLGTI